MSNVQQIIKRNAYAFGAGLFLLAATLPSILVPQSAAAAQLQERTVKMSSSTGGQAAQTYQIKFDAATTNSSLKAVVVDFCSDSPIVGTACAFPTGMTVGSTLADTNLGNGTWTASLINSNHSLLVQNASGDNVTSGEEVTIDVSGFTNPTGEIKFYARILTYADNTVADDYTSAAPGAHVDDGGVALMTAKAIGVTATVQESLTFCVSKTEPGAGCSGTDDPQLVLGDTNSTPVILDTQDVYEGDVVFQLSTNAVGATFVRMKGNTLTSGSNTIPAIGGATAQTIAAGTAKFGMKSTVGAGVVGNTEGSVAAVAPYDGGVGGVQYGLDTTTADDNITSTYGDVIASATGGVLNYNRTLTFGATAGATTPAGVYTSAFSLIASSSY